MDDAELSAFLFRANERGYSNPDEKTWVAEPDASTTIHFEDGPWRMHDNFFGGEPYGGREVVFYEARPAWVMVYYGWVAPEADASTVYGVLRRSLQRMPQEHPFRGPSQHTEGEFSYVNEWAGEVARFSGVERILDAGSLVYEATYAGGYVDVRRAV